MGANKDQNLVDRINNFLVAWQEMQREHYTAHFPILPVPVLSLIWGDKWVRVEKRDYPDREGGSISTFIALATFSTKALGEVKAGDIHKSATYKAPAKTARGSVYADDFGMSCMSSYGPAYLRG
jgi:hypothetical protein